MAKQKKTKPPARSRAAKADTQAAGPSKENYEQARQLLRRRADAIVLELAKRYAASKAAELTAVLDAMDSLAEFERTAGAALGVTGPASAGPATPASKVSEGGAGRPAASAIPLIADRSGAEAVMATGTVKWFSLQKGFGFIVNAATGKDVFVHISAVEKAGLTKLNEGQQIEFELEENRGKATAANLRVR
jgi:CspA family cold shock protein